MPWFSYLTRQVQRVEKYHPGLRKRRFMKVLSINTVYSSIARVALLTAFLLLLPLIAMQFTDDVVWNLTDFAVAGVLLFGAGLTFELAARRVEGIAYRSAIGIAVAAALILVWVNLAVGLIGAANNPANLMYFGVLAVAIVGALAVRFQSRGMAYVLFTTAMAQILVAVIAFISGLGEPLEIALINGFFVFLFTGSALLFWRAAQSRTG